MPNLRILTSVPMQSTSDRTVMVVPVTIDSSNKKFLLDTGGRVSQLSRATVQALDLPQRITEDSGSSTWREMFPTPRPRCEG